MGNANVEGSEQSIFSHRSKPALVLFQASLLKMLFHGTLSSDGSLCSTLSRAQDHQSCLSIPVSKHRALTVTAVKNNIYIAEASKFRALTEQYSLQRELALRAKSDETNLKDSSCHPGIWKYNLRGMRFQKRKVRVWRSKRHVTLVTQRFRCCGIF